MQIFCQGKKFQFSNKNLVFVKIVFRYTHESKFDTYACDYDSHECDSTRSSVIPTRRV
jgi:hypothetical protein